MPDPNPEKASELWQKLSERPRPSTTVPFPVPKGEKSPGDLVLWVLTDSELMSARANADTAAKKVLLGDIKPGDVGYHDIYSSECAVQILMRAARDPKSPNYDLPLFPSPERLRAKLTTDEISALIMSYGEFRRERGPYLSELTEPELEAWVKVLMEGASRVPLASLSGEALKDLIMYLGWRLRGSPTGTFSAGSPQDDSSSVTPSEVAHSTVDTSEIATPE
jgi:hypothetical protein